jgi:hypothetical protein
MTNQSDKMKKDTRTKPAKSDEPTRVTPERNNTQTGQSGNTRQNTTNQGYQQDR